VLAVQVDVAQVPAVEEEAMSEVASRPQPVRVPNWTAGEVLWFAWMEAMWGAFFALLIAGDLDRLWGWVRDLPVVAELVVWVACFPWMLGTAVWGSSWAGWLRLLLVFSFAAGWSFVSIPRPKKAPGT
jgi:hypothetical protein